MGAAASEGIGNADTRDSTEYNGRTRSRSSAVLNWTDWSSTFSTPNEWTKR